MELKIENFGPIKSFDDNFQRLNVFIGEQASGKSTICKLVYFALSLRDEMLDLFGNTKFFKTENCLKFYNSRCKNRFMNYFGSTYNMNRFNIKFKYESNNAIELNLREPEGQNYRFLNIAFNDRTKIESLLKSIQDYQKHFAQKDDEAEMFEYKIKKEKIINNIFDYFGFTEELIYIPAVRSIITTMSLQEQDLQEIFQTNILETEDEDDENANIIFKVDSITKKFIKDIFRKIKPKFVDGVDGLLKELRSRQKYSSRTNDFLNEAYNYFEMILKGKIYQKDDGEFLKIINTSKAIRFNLASSGQQECVWIMCYLFLIIAEDKQVVLFVEEPESHLFTKAQKDLIDFILLALNFKNKNIFFITTHSSYVLTEISNYIYAGLLEKDKLPEIIKKELILEKNKSHVFFLKNGNVRPVLKNNQIIESDFIDNEVNNEIEKLFNALLENDNAVN